MKRRKDNRGRVLKDGEYQRKNGTYEYKWTDATKTRRSIYAPDLDTLRKKEEEIRLESMFNLNRSADASLRDFCKHWLNQKMGIKNTTRDKYEDLINGYVDKSILGSLQVRQVTAADIKAYYGYLLSEKGLSISSINNFHKILLQVFDTAVDEKIIAYNPALKTLKDLKREAAITEKEEALKAQDSDKRELVLVGAERTAFYRFCEDLAEGRLKANTAKREGACIALFLAWTGMRIGEAAALEATDIDFENKLIKIKKAVVLERIRDGKTTVLFNGKSKYCKTISTPKSDCGTRSLVLLPQAKAVLELYNVIIAEKQNRKVAAEKGNGAHIFLSRSGNQISSGFMLLQLRTLVNTYNQLPPDERKRYGADKIPRISSHSLRHTFATLMVEKNVNIKALQKALGHANIEMTMNRYVTASDDFLIQEFQTKDSEDLPYER